MGTMTGVPRNIICLVYLVAVTAAWSPSPDLSKAKTSVSSATRSRRRFLFQATSILPLATKGTASSAAAPTTSDSALAQWKESVKTIDNLYVNYDTISNGGGDAIRRELGTANFGTYVSPLFQIDKAFKVLRDDPNVDLVEFTELAEEFTNALVRADTMAYSANFAGGSGKPTPPQVY